MLKKIVASLLTSVGLLSLNANPTLAIPAVNFAARETIYPSTCTIAIEGEKYTCDYTVVGAFNDASANIKLCSTRYCFILILSPTQLANLADGEDIFKTANQFLRVSFCSTVDTVSESTTYL